MSARWTEEEKEALFLVVTEHAHRNKSDKVCVNWGEVAVALGLKDVKNIVDAMYVTVRVPVY